MSPIKYSLNPQYSQGNLYAFNELEFDSPVWQKKLFPAFRFLFSGIQHVLCPVRDQCSFAKIWWACCSQLYHKPVMNNKDEISYRVVRLELIYHCQPQPH